MNHNAGFWIATLVALFFGALYIRSRYAHKQKMSQFNAQWGNTAPQEKWDEVLGTSFPQKKDLTPQKPPETPQNAKNIIVLSVTPNLQHGFSAPSLKCALQETNLMPTPKNIYQRLDLDQNVCFQVVSLLEPGTFDPAWPNTSIVPGILLLMVLPLETEPVSAFEDMMTTAHRLAHLLSGTVCDGQRVPLTSQKLKEYQALVEQYSKLFEATNAW